MYTVVTSADTNFFNLALGLARTLPSGAPLWLYDLGLTPNETAVLQGMGVTVQRIPVPADSFAFNSVNNIRTVHKMDCIEHCMAARQAGVIMLDADVLVLDAEVLHGLIPSTPDEVVVTYRCIREQKPHVLVNGRINAGVMAFGGDVPATFFQAWKNLCADPEHTDQSALSLLLEQHGVDWSRLDEAQTLESLGINVRVLDGNIYNDTSCRTGGIFHFKSAGRRGNKRFWYQLFVTLLRCFPDLMCRAVRENRRRGLLVWKPRAADARGDV